MKKNSGFTSFEFYFVMAAIGIVMLVGLQRYSQLGEQTKRFSFQVLAQHFNTSLYNFRVQWILGQQHTGQPSGVYINGMKIQFNAQGWPVSVVNEENKKDVSLSGCYELWINLLQAPPPISYNGNAVYGARPYHLSVVDQDTCRYELVTKRRAEYYFDYSPKNGQVVIHIPET